MHPCAQLPLLLGNVPATPLELDGMVSHLQQLEISTLGAHSRTQQPVPATKSVSLQSMPLELWGRVFDFAATCSDRVSDTYGYTDKEVVKKFCLVCRAWRDGAYLEGGPWGRIHICFDELSPKAFSTLRNWLNRASRSTSVLKILASKVWGSFDEVQCVCKENPEQDGEETEGEAESEASGDPCWLLKGRILQELLSSDIPLNRLHLSCSAYLCFRKLMESVHVKTNSSQTSMWSQLRELELSFGSHYDYAWSDPSDHSKSTFSYLPAGLQSLELRYTWNLKVLPSSIPSPNILGQLSSLTLRIPFFSFPYRFLEGCRQLERLSLNFSGTEPKGYNRSSQEPQRLSSLPKIVLPALQFLCLENLPPIPGPDEHNERVFKETVGYLVLPKLQHLSLVRALSPNSIGSLPLLLSSMNVLPSQLVSFTFANHMYWGDPLLSVEDLAPVLGRLTSLTCLRFQTIGIEGDFFESLRRASALGDQCVIPSLQELEFDDIGQDSFFNLQSLLYLVTARSLDGQIDGQDGTGQLTPRCLRKVIVRHYASDGLWERWEEGYGDIDTLRGSYGVIVERFNDE